MMGGRIFVDHDCEWKDRHDMLLKHLEFHLGEPVPPEISLVDIARELTEEEYEFAESIDMQELAKDYLASIS